MNRLLPLINATLEIKMWPVTSAPGKSCLADCDSHLQPHGDAAPLQKHKLVEPTYGLSVSVCPGHDEVMKIFCRTDWQSICYLCSMGEHRGPNTVSAAAERKERQRELEETRGDPAGDPAQRERLTALMTRQLRTMGTSSPS